MKYIDSHKVEFGVEPICTVLQTAPSTYYAATTRPPSLRSIEDEKLKVEVMRCWIENEDGVYGAYKIWRQLRREGFDVGRDRVARLMRELAICGVVRGKKWRTNIPDELSARPADLVDRPVVGRRHHIHQPWQGVVYAAFVTDVFSRYIVGWRVHRTLKTDLALDALEMALWQRGEAHDGLIHHSDRGSQYRSIRYTERLAESGVDCSVGSRGDSYDNAMAEAVHSLYKAEAIYKKGPWKSYEALELATARWVDWWNHRRIHGSLGDIPPVDFEAQYHVTQTAPEAA
ncbi:MAG: IS3 family transposase [Candidatus Dormibacteria bacterium]